MWARLRRRLLRLLRSRGSRKQKPYHRILEGVLPAALAREGRDGDRAFREYTVDLPAGLAAQRLTVRISMPLLPARPSYAFTEHVMDESGRPTQTVIAATTGGFAVSPDLGETWRMIRIAPYRRRRFLHVKALSTGEYLAQVEPLQARRDKPHAVDTIVVDESGAVLASSPLLSVPWHSCRAVDARDGVVMFAEYPPNPGHDNRLDSRVFKSRDRGRGWQIAFERNGTQIRHFQFLQARPGSPHEWWLSSGDSPDESRMWVTKNDGDDWTDVTMSRGKKVRVGGAQFPRDLFRLTDLAWNGADAVWGTDDLLWSVEGAQPGARIFASRADGQLAPREVGRGRWHIRTLVDVGEFYIATSQGCPEPDAVGKEAARPGVYLVPKSVPQLVHLFDVDTFSGARTGFTYARASRVALNGTFFTFRGAKDAFRGGHQILRWDVTFE
jgi:hypothetical protein